MQLRPLLCGGSRSLHRGSQQNSLHAAACALVILAILCTTTCADTNELGPSEDQFEGCVRATSCPAPGSGLWAFRSKVASCAAQRTADTNSVELRLVLAPSAENAHPTAWLLESVAAFAQAAAVAPVTWLQPAAIFGPQLATDGGSGGVPVVAQGSTPASPPLAVAAATPPPSFPGQATQRGEPAPPPSTGLHASAYLVHGGELGALLDPPPQQQDQQHQQQQQQQADAVQDLTALARVSRALPWFKYVHLVQDITSQYNSRIMALPLQTNPLLLYYRRDVFAAAGLPPPRTWREAVAAAAALNGTAMGPGDGAPGWGMCLWQPAECGEAAVAAPLLAVLGSVVQTGGHRYGMHFHPQRMTPVVDTPAWEYALGLLAALGRYAAPPGAEFGSGSAVGGSRRGMATGPLCFRQPLFTQGRCAMALAGPAEFKASSRSGGAGARGADGQGQEQGWEAGAVRGRVGTAVQPGSDVVLDWSSELPRLVPCDQDTCPYGKLYGRSSYSAISATVAELLSGALPGVPPAAQMVCDGTEAADVTLAAGATSGPPGCMLVNHAPYADESGLYALVGRQGGLGERLMSFTLAVQLAGQAASWPAVASPDTPTGPMLMEQLDPVYAATWQAYGGYHTDDLMSYLATVGAAAGAENTVLGVRCSGLASYTQLLAATTNSLAWKELPSSADGASSGGANLSVVALAAWSRARLRAAYTPAELLALKQAYTSSLSTPQPYIPVQQGSKAAAGRSSGGHHWGVRVLLPVLLAVGLLLVLGAAAGHVYAKWKTGRRKKHHITAPGVGPETTLCVTDIQDSTALWESLPAAVMDRAVHLHHACLRSCGAACRAYESATEGDSFILAFHSPLEALTFCLSAQEQLPLLDWPEELLQAPSCQPLWAMDMTPPAAAAPPLVQPLLQPGGAVTVRFAAPSLLRADANPSLSPGAVAAVLSGFITPYAASPNTPVSGNGRKQSILRSLLRKPGSASRPRQVNALGSALSGVPAIGAQDGAGGVEPSRLSVDLHLSPGWAWAVTPQGQAWVAPHSNGHGQAAGTSGLGWGWGEAPQLRGRHPCADPGAGAGAGAGGAGTGVEGETDAELRLSASLLVGAGAVLHSADIEPQDVQGPHEQLRAQEVHPSDELGVESGARSSPNRCRAGRSAAYGGACSTAAATPFGAWRASPSRRGPRAGGGDGGGGGSSGSGVRTIGQLLFGLRCAAGPGGQDAVAWAPQAAGRRGGGARALAAAAAAAAAAPLVSVAAGAMTPASSRPWTHHGTTPTSPTGQGSGAVTPPPPPPPPPGRLSLRSPRLPATLLQTGKLDRGGLLSTGRSITGATPPAGGLSATCPHSHARARLQLLRSMSRSESGMLDSPTATPSITMRGLRGSGGGRFVTVAVANQGGGGSDASALATPTGRAGPSMALMIASEQGRGEGDGRLPSGAASPLSPGRCPAEYGSDEESAEGGFEHAPRLTLARPAGTFRRGPDDTHGTLARAGSSIGALLSAFGGGVGAGRGGVSGGGGGGAPPRLLLRGLRVRMACHSGVACAADVRYNSRMARVNYSGSAMATAKAVTNGTAGGMVCISASTHRLLTASTVGYKNGTTGQSSVACRVQLVALAVPPVAGVAAVGEHQAVTASHPGTALATAVASTPQRVIFWHGGVHSLDPLLPPVEFYMAATPSQVPRWAALHVPLGPGTKYPTIAPGVGSAPVGHVATAAVSVPGAAALAAWDASVWDTCAGMLWAEAASLCTARGGYLVTPRSRGTRSGGLTSKRPLLKAVFPTTAAAVEWSAWLLSWALRAQWPRELLQHELGEVLLTGADTAQDPHHAHGQPQPSQPSDLPPLGTWDPQGIRARRRAVLKSGRLSLSSFRAASRRGSLQSAQGSKRDPQDDTRSEQLFPLARVAPLCSQEGVGYDGRCVTDGGFSLVSCSNQGSRAPTQEGYRQDGSTACTPTHGPRGPTHHLHNTPVSTRVTAQALQGLLRPAVGCSEPLPRFRRVPSAATTTHTDADTGGQFAGCSGGNGASLLSDHVLLAAKVAQIRTWAPDAAASGSPGSTTFGASLITDCSNVVCNGAGQMASQSAAGCTGQEGPQSLQGVGREAEGGDGPVVGYLVGEALGAEGTREAPGPGLGPASAPVLRVPCGGTACGGTAAPSSQDADPEAAAAADGMLWPVLDGEEGEGAAKTRALASLAVRAESFALRARTSTAGGIASTAAGSGGAPPEPQCARIPVCRAGGPLSGGLLHIRAVEQQQQDEQQQQQQQQQQQEWEEQGQRRSQPLPQPQHSLLLRRRITQSGARTSLLRRSITNKSVLRHSHAVHQHQHDGAGPPPLRSWSLSGAQSLPARARTAYGGLVLTDAGGSAVAAGGPKPLTRLANSYISARGRVQSFDGRRMLLPPTGGEVLPLAAPALAATDWCHAEAPAVPPGRLVDSLEVPGVARQASITDASRAARPDSGGVSQSYASATAGWWLAHTERMLQGPAARSDQGSSLPVLPPSSGAAAGWLAATEAAVPVAVSQALGSEDSTMLGRQGDTEEAEPEAEDKQLEGLLMGEPQEHQPTSTPTVHGVLELALTGPGRTAGAGWPGATRGTLPPTVLAAPSSDRSSLAWPSRPGSSRHTLLAAPSPAASTPRASCVGRASLGSCRPARPSAGPGSYGSGYDGLMGPPADPRVRPSLDSQYGSVRAGSARSHMQPSAPTVPRPSLDTEGSLGHAPWWALLQQPHASRQLAGGHPLYSTVPVMPPVGESEHLPVEDLELEALLYGAGVAAGRPGAGWGEGGEGGSEIQEHRLEQGGLLPMSALPRVLCRGLRLRFGIDAGEATVEIDGVIGAARYRGQAVSRAYKLAEVCPPSHILISREAGASYARQASTDASLARQLPQQLLERIRVSTKQEGR